MRHSKLIGYLSRFSSQEMKDFRHFLQSPYHNSNKQALRLLEGLLSYHPDFDSPRLTKEKDFSKDPSQRQALP